MRKINIEKATGRILNENGGNIYCPMIGRFSVCDKIQIGLCTAQCAWFSTEIHTMIQQPNSEYKYGRVARCQGNVIGELPSE